MSPNFKYERLWKDTNMDVDPGTVFPRTKIGRDHQLRDQFRHGKVIDRKMDPKRGPVVRVQFLDKQGLVSYWLSVKQFGSRKTMHLYVPKIGDDVNVNMLANGSEDGFVDGSFFNSGNPPPEGVDIDTRHFQTEDGTIIQYRENDSTFNMNCVGEVIITAEGEIRITSAITVVITAPTIVLNGLMIFNGNIQHTGNMNTTGVHTDANGIHQSMSRDEELHELRSRLSNLEARLNALEATA